MGRPRLSNSVHRERERVGEALRQLRRGQHLTLDAVCSSLAQNVTKSRLWGIEKGNLPYAALLFQLSSLYSASPEAIIEQATGQSSLNLLGSFFIPPVEPDPPRQSVDMPMTSEEEALVRTYLDWIRFRKMMGVLVD